MFSVSIPVAFLAGLASFLAPCVLPIIPGFLSYLGGASVGEATARRKDIFLNSFFFVLGFSIIFAALGVLLSTILERVAYDVQAWLSRIGGAIVIFFGLYLVRIIKIPFLDQEYKFHPKFSFKSRHLTSFLFGAAFAAGWTPCVGPALGAILGVAAAEPGLAFVLLLSYSLGLGVPFLIVGLFTSRADVFIGRHAKALGYVNIAFGAILIVLGVLIFTQQLSRIANFEFLNKILLSQ